MNVSELSNLSCQAIKTYNGTYEEQTVLCVDTETIRGKPESIQFYDGISSHLEYVNEHTIMDCYLDYVSPYVGRGNLSVWFFYCQFDIPIIQYPYKDLFTRDNHGMQYGPWSFQYIHGKTWYGNHKYKGREWNERDAYQYVFRGLEKIAKDLKFDLQKKERPTFLGERKWKNEYEKRIFEEYAIQDVLVLWELVHWILSIHRQFDVGLSVSLADLCGKIFRKKFVENTIVPTSSDVTLAALSSYHGGKTQSYVKGPIIVKDIVEYDVTSAYPFAMSQIGNFFDYTTRDYRGDIRRDGLYNVSAKIKCGYQPIFTEEFKRESTLKETWITGYELQSCLEKNCIDYTIHSGYVMEFSLEGKSNGLADYIWHFYEKKDKATKEGNITEKLVAKLALNTLYGKFISRITEDTDIGDKWKGGVIFHPFIATLITGFVRAYMHDIEHAGHALHTSTDSIITQDQEVDKQFPGVRGLGALKKEHSGDVLIVRPKVYVIFDHLDASCYHRFTLDGSTVVCKYCQGQVLKAATHGFFGSVHMLLNMWRNDQKNYIVNKMIRLKEAKRSRDPDTLPFVFKNVRRSLNVDWSKLTLYKGGHNGKG